MDIKVISNVAVIVPPAWNSFFPSVGFQLVLAPWLREKSKFTETLGRRRRGSYLIVDNGTFEHSRVSLEELCKLAASVEADEVVLPDRFGDARATLEGSWSALGQVSSKTVMFVSQGKTSDEWAKCLDAWITKWQGSVWPTHYSLCLGINSVRPENGSQPVIGSRLKNLVEASKYGYNMHILGIPDVPEFANNELPVALEKGVRSFDTSIPFVLGAHGKLLTPDSEKIKLGAISTYDKLSDKCRRLIYLNTSILRSWAYTGVTNQIPGTVIREAASRWCAYWQVGFASLESVMKECRMPSGKYVICTRAFGEYIRIPQEEDTLEEWEEEVRL